MQVKKPLQRTEDIFGSIFLNTSILNQAGVNKSQCTANLKLIPKLPLRLYRKDDYYCYIHYDYVRRYNKYLKKNFFKTKIERK